MKHLSENKVTVHGYTTVVAKLQEISAGGKSLKISIDKKKIN